jgi:hypothetical protein
MRTKLSALVAIALTLGACTQGPAAREDRSRSEPSDLRSDVLLLQSESGPVAVRASTGKVLFDAAGALPSPDGSIWYTTSHAPSLTHVETVDAASGRVLHRTALDGELAIRAVSRTGRALALTAPSRDGLVPAPRARTPIVIADPTGTSEPRRYVLQGNFEPEAFSVNDRRLFLIQHLPALAPVVYRVTVLDLASGEVSPIRGRFDAPPEQMAGMRLGQIWGRDARQLYTLYSSERPTYAQPTTGFDLEHPGVSFIHVLDARDGWAFCVTLPDAMRHHSSRGLVMAASADGGHLYLVDTMTGIVAVVDLAALQVIRYGAVLKVPPGPEASSRPSALVSTDGRTLFVGGINDWGLVAIDTSTLRLTNSLIPDDVVSGLGSSSDGERLYASMLDRVAVLDAQTGDEIGSVPFTGADAIVEILTAA